MQSRHNRDILSWRRIVIYVNAASDLAQQDARVLVKCSCRMKPRYIAGAIAIAIGIFWIVGITRFLITDILPVQLKFPTAWADQIYFPASALSTLLYLAFLGAWIYYSYNSRFKSSEEAKNTISLWFSILAISIISNVISLVLFIQFTVVQAPAMQGAMQGGTFVDMPPYEFLIPMTLINAFLLYWIPSCFLTQRTVRFVPPFSYELNSIAEKR